ncbi:hypothetical protein L6452_31096 [Arctium lappa]|uniref:Uncharacterized protein n=1 Tax=Arctium lappa TaxID=4217 RepID=A0ACB8ZIZ7_ARCLA|nr:hypothetical protein L6452_31096 [Arctium lappa]
MVLMVLCMHMGRGISHYRSGSSTYNWEVVKNGDGRDYGRRSRMDARVRGTLDKEVDGSGGQQDLSRIRMSMVAKVRDEADQKGWRR